MSNHVLHMRNRIIEVYQKLIKIILHILAKRHQHIKSCISSFRPILSSHGTPAYKLVKLFVPSLVL